MSSATKKILILDYQLGNLFSVKQALEKIGLPSFISSDKNQIQNADAVVLPGVGAFGEAMANLHKLDLVSPLKEYVQTDKPLFGICLGQQLLFSESEEFGTIKGLDFIAGSIKKFPKFTVLNDNVKVPQIGWNRIYKNDTAWGHTPFEALHENEYMYFVHSYYVAPQDKANILSLTNYEGVEYCSATIKNKNIFATQFHPEKSGTLGIRIYETWAKQHRLI